MCCAFLSCLGLASSWLGLALPSLASPCLALPCHGCRFCSPGKPRVVTCARFSNASFRGDLAIIRFYFFCLRRSILLYRLISSCLCFSFLRFSSLSFYFRFVAFLGHGFCVHPIRAACEPPKLRIPLVCCLLSCLLTLYFYFFLSSFPCSILMNTRLLPYE